MTCLQDFDILIQTEQTVKSAIQIYSEYRLQYFDSLLLATAAEGECEIFYSEDMQHEQIIGNSLKIINPFLEQN